MWGRREIVLAAALLFLAGGAAAQVTIIPNPIGMPVGQAFAHFGWSVAWVGSSVAVGDPCRDTGDLCSGAAYLFDGTTGALLHTIPNPSPTFLSEFGIAVAAFGSDLLVGAPDSPLSSATGDGAVYLFDGATAALLQTYANPDADDEFGSALAAIGSRVFVGAPTNDVAGPAAGIVRMFDGASGVLLDTFAPPPGGEGRFGQALLAIGSDILVGAPYANGGLGAAYLLDGTSGAVLQSYQSPGWSLAAVGSSVVVGDLAADIPGTSDVGAAFTFDLTAGTLLASLANPAPAACDFAEDDDCDQFAKALATLGSTVVAGVPGADTGATDAGVVYVVDPANGTILNSILSPTLDAHARFGASIAVGTDRLAIAAPGGDEDAFVALFGPCGNGRVDPGEECDDGNVDDGDCCTSACAIDVTPCGGPAPGKSLLKLVARTSSTGTNKDALVWKWVGEDAVDKSDFGVPGTSSGVSLCVIDWTGGAPSLRLAATAPATWQIGGKASWKETTSGFKFSARDRTPNGLKRLGLGAGPAGAAKLRAKGQAALLGLPELPLTAPVTVRLRRSDAPVCWEAVYDSGISLNIPNAFKAKSD